ncbi:DUF2156 domain-containing protein [Butyrivibrio sp. CB08]|uniref:phosphatidylglycerol lysyltransferase domain-containing protein n=1 Tax=Butyrivibrio sp. CB08 TaxID=2364879 RepID=UPI000EAA603C|nr:phosphatidylglycerol lysyltransferase domain-containing protein [Butyrivibrio sp. CB08]RKM60544.1 DUF2156 domain-containing protein [Butyrivibrio sp. CB08]
MPNITTQTIEPSLESEISRIYDSYGKGDSAHAYKTLYIWAKDMSLSVYLVGNMYAAHIDDEGENTWFFPVGEDEEKRRFIEDVLKEGNLILRYVTKEDTFFLQQYFPGKFVTDPAPDDSEYIYDRNTIENLPGGGFSRKRDYVRQLCREHDMETKLFSKALLGDVRTIFDAWSKSKENYIDVMDKAATELILDEFDELDISGIVLYMDGAPSAAVLGYRLSDNTVDCCMQKTDNYLHGLQYYMRQEFSRMQPEEVTFFNWEEDLGIQGLRTAKQYMHPCSMIDMYTGRQL